MYETVPELHAAAAALARWCARLDPEALVRPDDVHTVEVELARLGKLIQGAQLRVARRVAQAKVWTRSGDASAVAYLARLQGSTAAAARSQLAASAALPRWDATDVALRRGQLSATQAETVIDAAEHTRQAQAAAAERARREADAAGNGGETAAKPAPSGEATPHAQSNRVADPEGASGQGQAHGVGHRGHRDGNPPWGQPAPGEEAGGEPLDARAAEQQLLESARREPLSRLREQARQTKTTTDADAVAAARRVYRQRRLRRWHDEHGSYHLALRTTALEGATLDARCSR